MANDIERYGCGARHETSSLNGMFCFLCSLALLRVGAAGVIGAAVSVPIPNQFSQEIAQNYGLADGLSATDIQCLDIADGQPTRIRVAQHWAELRSGRWEVVPALNSTSPDQFTLPDLQGKPIHFPVPKGGVQQIIRRHNRVCLVTPTDLFQVLDGRIQSLTWSNRAHIHQAAIGPADLIAVASDDGLFEWAHHAWSRVPVQDSTGRLWSAGDILGVTFDSADRLWIATRAGVAFQGAEGWRFFEGKDGLPYNEFTGLAAGPDGAVWMGTRLGLIRFKEGVWFYRQGPLWLPDDHIRQVAVDLSGRAWVITPAGLGCIEQQPMTLAAKAALYETEIDKYIKRTPFGFVAEAPLEHPGDKSSARPQDSDNDGLWTAMYGAAECFDFAATGDPAAQFRARQAFHALQFLQTVTQGGPHSPPDGFVARTIRPRDWPDPNIGRLEGDRHEQQEDKLWKVYEPRWPVSADGKWYWKSDTSSDELDGHYFFYPLYYDFCATSDADKLEVQSVVRKLTDHLLQHHFVLIDHDGQPTRWAVYGPRYLNRDPAWWAERGLNSLSVLSYLAVAAHVTEDPKYAAASRELIDKHGYALNAMYPKVQHGPGSGNQSDDEMAFMCYYSLLRYSRDEALKGQIRFSFFRYWANEASELNPFFNFAYAAHNLGTDAILNWGIYSLSPWDGWLEDSRDTLCGFPLDRRNWSHRNSHRLDLVPLGQVQAKDLYESRGTRRGYRINGKVLPVENRHFNHWNTDPWELDYGGNGNELASGTVYLLPYYLGMYHGFVEKP